jgi:hypothetical protein
MEGAVEGQGGEKKGVMTGPAALGDFTPKLREGRKKKAWEGPLAYHEEAVMKVHAHTEAQHDYILSLDEERFD